MVKKKILELHIEPASDFGQLAGFSCGIDEMDEFIHHFLETCNRINFVKTYFVYNEKNEIVALFSLNANSVILDFDDFDDINKGYRDQMEPLTFTSDKDFLDRYFYSHHIYPTVEIQYLAVRKDYRSTTNSLVKLYIGKTLINIITEKSKEMIIGALFLSVDAYDTDRYSAVPFYEKCGFGVVDYVRKGDIRRMIKTIWVDNHESK